MTPTKLIPRDTSWLHFNARVLQEATDKSVPLYERIKFLAIYSSNLDEFFRVRVSTLRQFKKLDKKKRQEFFDFKPKNELQAIRKLVNRQQEEFGRIFAEEILPGLREEGIHLVHGFQFNEEQQAFAADYFDREVAPLLTVNELSSEGEGESPFIEDQQLYLAVDIADDDDERLLLVNIPSPPKDRFMVLPSDENGYYVTFLDSIIRANLERFLGMKIDGAYSFKLSRDAQMYINNEFDGDLLEKIETSLDERDSGLPTRFLYDFNTPEWMRQALKKRLGLSKYDMIPGARYHNFNDFFGFPLPEGKEHLVYVDQPPLAHPALEKAESLMACLEEKDHLLNFPYQRYDYVPRLIREAADDPEVERIQITLYRVAKKSEVVTNLLYARSQGKKVEVFVEAKARFDEKSNLFWGKKLEEAGAYVRYSYPAVKVHTKLFRITRRTNDKYTYYSYIGTGNFNEKTAKLYGDHALLTINPELGDDVGKVFSLLRGKLIIPNCKHLLVAPFDMKERFKKLIKAEIRAAKAGKEAYFFLKMNSLEEPEMIELIQRAAVAGVKVQLIVRGICRYLPGSEDDVEIISIIDRYLEHARIFIFGNGGEEKIFIGSADWMKRNLSRRVEVITPIFDEGIKKQLRDIMDMQWRDNTKARYISGTNSNGYRAAGAGEEVYRAQEDLYGYFAGKE